MPDRALVKQMGIMVRGRSACWSRLVCQGCYSQNELLGPRRLLNNGYGGMSGLRVSTRASVEEERYS